MKHGDLIDMDGVIYKGSEIIPGAPEFINSSAGYGDSVSFLTNNSTFTPLDVVVKLRKFDIHTTVEHVTRPRSRRRLFTASGRWEPRS